MNPTSLPNQAAAIRVQPMSAVLGARVLGLDASQPLPPETQAKLRDTWHAYGVLCLPGQSVDETQQVRFGQCFGELATTQGEYKISTSHPGIMYITNEKENGEYIGALPDGEMFFHADMCYVEKPPKATMLFAIHVPKQGGNTVFADMAKAYDSLPEDVRTRILDLKAVNSYEPGTTAPTVAMRTRGRASSLASSPDRRSFTHPMVSTHPATGRKSLYVNRLMTESIEGLPRAESDELLEYLFDFQERPEFIYSHQWTPGDLLIWDNLRTLHARTHFDASELRKMRRITIKGDRIV